MDEKTTKTAVKAEKYRGTVNIPALTGGTHDEIAAAALREAALYFPPGARLEAQPFTAYRQAEDKPARYATSAGVIVHWVADEFTSFGIADQAIGMFLEYRDQHGYAEEDARGAAALEVAEGMAVTDAELRP